MTTFQTSHYPVKVLENERLRLDPFTRSSHSKLFFDATHGTEVWKYFPIPGPKSLDQWNEWYPVVENDPAWHLWAVITKKSSPETRESDNFAGVIGLQNIDVDHGVTEIGFVIMVPKYHRTYVASNAVGLLLMYGLDPPSQGGLGLRRLQWQTNARNEASIRLAKRMHMTFEGVARWNAKVPFGLGNGEDATLLHERNGTTEEKPGRHTAFLSMCWDDWIDKREEVLKVMNHRQ